MDIICEIQGKTEILITTEQIPRKYSEMKEKYRKTTYRTRTLEMLVKTGKIHIKYS